MLKGPSPHIKFGLPLSKSWLKACYTGNALKPFPFQFDDSSFDRALSNCFLLLSLNFSRFFLVSFSCPWMISWLKSIKSIHIPQYFVIIDFVQFFKLINWLLSSNIDFIDLSNSFPIIDFDRFVTPCITHNLAGSAHLSLSYHTPQHKHAGNHK